MGCSANWLPSLWQVGAGRLHWRPHARNVPAVRSRRQKVWPGAPVQGVISRCRRTRCTICVGARPVWIRAPCRGGPCCRGICPGCAQGDQRLLIPTFNQRGTRPRIRSRRVARIAMQVRSQRILAVSTTWRPLDHRCCEVVAATRVHPSTRVANPYPTLGGPRRPMSAVQLTAVRTTQPGCSPGSPREYRQEVLVWIGPRLSWFSVCNRTKIQPAGSCSGCVPSGRVASGQPTQCDRRDKQPEISQCDIVVPRERQQVDNDSG